MQDSMQLKQQLESYLEDILINIGGIKSEIISKEKNFMDMGVDSTKLISISSDIEKKLKIELYPTLFFEYQNLKELVDYFVDEHAESFAQHFEYTRDNPREFSPESRYIESRQQKTYQQSDRKLDEQIFWNEQRSVQEEKVLNTEDIAIIGMHGYFAESENLDEFWNNLSNQKDLIKEIPNDHFDYRPWFDPDPDIPNKLYCKWGSFVNDVDKFDASFFNISRREAEMMDPQLRLSLQAMYSAAEDAGYASKIKGSSTGVFVGACFSDYSTENLSNQKIVDPYDGIGNASTMLANRPSFFFNMTGPSLAVDTACSSSLVALHMAMQALKNEDCEMAFVNGVNLLLSSWHYRYFSSIGALSHTGRCHTFDAAADGYVPGESIVSILLKPLGKAQNDGDRIYAVIKGSAISHGGYTPSITAPSVTGESDVIKRAWKKTGIHPENIGYIEAHGTGTKLGDPIEVQAIIKAFKDNGIKEGRCAIGSAKAHIGHAEGAAGLAAVVKVVLSMRHKIIPAMPKFTSLNPLIKLDGSPLFINRQNTQWKKKDGSPRLAGINSFGFGGSYAHVIIEEWETDVSKYTKSNTRHRFPVIVPISAKNADRLTAYGKALLNYLENSQETFDEEYTLENIAYSLQMGRESMDFRVAFLVNTREELIAKLADFVEGSDKSGSYLKAQVQKDNTIVNLLSEDEFLKEVFNKWSENGHISKLAELWVNGINVDWGLLYNKDPRPNLISLPTYPFAKDRYWVSDTDTLKTNKSFLYKKNAKFKSKPKKIMSSVVPKPTHDTDISQVIEIDIKQLISEILKIDSEQLDTETNLTEFGFDSIAFSSFSQSLSQFYEIDISPSAIFGHGTIEELIKYFLENYRDIIQNHYEVDCESGTGPDQIDVSDTSESNEDIWTDIESTVQPEKIAIIGMSCRFPMAQTIKDFWNNLVEGKDCIEMTPPDRWDWREFNGASKNGANATKWGGFIDGVGDFDTQFFRIPPEEAKVMDPNQRLMLEHVYSAIEDAGYDPMSLSGSNTGLFIGVGNSGYHSLCEDAGIDYAATNILSSIVPNRISYYLDLHGPSEPIETACASSLIAIHRGITALNTGTSDMVIVGGINTILLPVGHVALNNVGMLSDDGKCKPFSADANGFVRSEGVGVLILKRLSCAEQDRDHIYGTILGSGENHGGRSNFLTAPNPLAQAEILENVYRKSEIDPRMVTYIETHGTGTMLGDNIEIDSLNNAFGSLLKKTADTSNIKDNMLYCGLGSVKSNIGHTEIASGMASVIKTLLQLKYKTLVPTLHCKRMNPHINLEETPFFIVNEKQDWNAIVDNSGRSIPRIAGVSSFGLSGVNAHIIIEEYVSLEKEPVSVPAEPQLIVLSAKNQSQLQAVVENLFQFVKENKSSISLLDLAYTLQIGREHMDSRVAMIVADNEELLVGLEHFLDQAETTSIPLFHKENLGRKRNFKQMENAKIKVLIAENNLEKIGSYWVKGGKVPWELLSGNKGACRISLPAYPFARNRYWIENRSGKTASSFTAEDRANHSFNKAANEAKNITLFDIEISPIHKDYKQSNLYQNWFL